MKKYVVGIDIGGTSVKIGLFLHDGTLVDKWELRTGKGKSGDEILDDIYRSIVQSEVSLQDIEGYGFGIPGPVVNNKVLTTVNLDVGDFAWVDGFKKRTGSSNVYIANDANAAALGETIFGAAKGYPDVAMITLGTGVGGGLIHDYKIIDGYHGAAGEIGHLRVDSKHGRPCTCGGVGCLETVASATGIKKEFFERLQRSDIPSVLSSVDDPSAKMIVDAAKDGDPVARDTFEFVTDRIGYACHLVSVTSNPAIIMLGGGVSKAGDFLLERVNYYFQKYTFSAVSNTEIRLAELGNDAGIYGAASLVIQHD